MLQLQHVTKYYGKNLANDDISFQVEEGQIAILLGPQRGGKIHHHQVHCGSAPVPGGDHHRRVWK